MFSNRKIDSLILSASNWAIDTRFAMSELNKYLSDLEAREAGVSFSELGISQRRAAMLPRIMSESGQLLYTKGSSTSDANSLQNTDIPRNSFAILTLKGAMRAEGDWCSYGMRDFESWIQDINANRNLKGIMIRANSGGGETIAGQILKNAIADSSKPVVVHADLLGSAAVDGTLTAKERIASGLAAEFGSIGVYANINKKLVEWHQENIEEVYSELSPQKNIEFREFLKGNKGPMIEAVNEAAGIFQSEVKRYLPKVAKNKSAMEGKLFYAAEAKQIGLVDGIGNFSYALRRLAWHVNNPS